MLQVVFVIVSDDLQWARQHFSNSTNQVNRRHLNFHHGESDKRDRVCEGKLAKAAAGILYPCKKKAGLTSLVYTTQ